MSRSKWKGEVLNIIFAKKKFKKKIWGYVSRCSSVAPKLVDTSVTIYNGKTYSDLKIKKEMVGHKLGEFSFTRAKYEFKKKKKKRRLRRK